jgi:hypothetical protein
LIAIIIVNHFFRHFSGLHRSGYACPKELHDYIGDELIDDMPKEAVPGYELEEGKLEIVFLARAIFRAEEALKCPGKNEG